jgi:hypothetical protein
MSRTVSCRISTDLHEELRDRCNKLGCSINDFVAESIKFTMYGYAEFAFDPEEEREETKTIPELTQCEKSKSVVKGTVRVIKLGD